ncbi:hypothetical protein BB561_001511 [Smittium simulii]|uniref:CP-type G domain-containing protein n=1 Tax=Smittium simulii TaxID=133385 RepID=A0A2T9YUD5_9FUNG|nr:hypothetical protein BB561_001511 [Smittium simulii]
MSVKFRSAFEFTKSINWFPGHMAKGLAQIKTFLPKIDFFIEVRDARAPFSSINPGFEKLIDKKKRFIVYNKADMIPPESKIVLSETLSKLGEKNFFFTSINSHQTLDTILTSIREHYSADSGISSKIMSLVVGMPNVGKSSLINALRNVGTNKGKAVKTGDTPGLTRSVSNYVIISKTPQICIYDTPGVMAPYIPNPLSSLKFALTGGIKDKVLDNETLSDFLLYLLNKSNNTEYVSKFQLESPIDDINYLLCHVARKSGALLKGGIPQLDVAARFFLRQYYMGNIGYICFDNIEYSDVILDLAENEKFGTVSKNQTKKLMTQQKKQIYLEKRKAKLERKRLDKSFKK